MSSPWQEHYRLRSVDAAQALAALRPGNRVFVGSGCAEPVLLVSALAERQDLRDVEVLHIMTVGNAPYAKAAHAGRFRHNAFFIGSNVREAVGSGEADYTPVFLSEIPGLLRAGGLKPDVALISTSPPDAHGWCSLGVSVDVVRAASQTAGIVIAEVNPNMPRTHGDGFIHVDDVDFFVSNDVPILEIAVEPPDEVGMRIGRFCADLVPDGATMQLGIGGIPNAVLAGLAGKRDLGLHSEMISDGVVDLIESGVINGRRKTIHPGKAVTSFCLGTRRLYDFVHDNPAFAFLPTEYVNDPVVIARNSRMISINSALQVDLTGQVCADSIGSRFYSGIGGQVDFIRGAARSPGGRSILALPSTAKGGTVSRIVATLTEGAGVVTTRGDVHTIVTEYGVAEMKGRTVRERALSLISIAHPSFRSQLLEAARQRRFVPPSQEAWPAGGRPYPVELESRSTFKGSEIRFRPIRPADERLLRDFYYSRTQGSARAQNPPGPEQIRSDCQVDYDRRLAIVGLAGEDREERMVAVARSDLDPATGLAELSFRVHEDLQGRGVGTWLFERILEAARARGAQGFTAQVPPSNIRMLHIFQRSGLEVTSSLEGGVIRVTMRFRTPS
jgi:acyl-CoA hydrolase/GNAT superfamily N-acetyltransferase